MHGEGSVEEAVKFTGKELDPETGLYYFNARWYDPVLGRFTTEDPARDGVNWFVYVGHNPLRFIDPTGLFVYQMTNHVSLGNHHTFLLLVPDNMDDFKDSKYSDMFQSYTFANEHKEEVTRQGIILRAGPENDDIGDWGHLTARPNFRDSTAQDDVTSMNVVTPADEQMTDTELITNYLEKNNNYMQRQSQEDPVVPDYSFPPVSEIFGKERHKNIQGHNSNSYVSGINQSAGGVAPNPDVKTPMYDNPVPQEHFEPLNNGRSSNED